MRFCQEGGLFVFGNPFRLGSGALFLTKFAARLQLFLGRVATEGRAAADHFFSDVRMPSGAFELHYRRLVGGEPKPLHAFKNRRRRFRCGALAISILDTQKSYNFV